MDLMDCISHSRAKARSKPLSMSLNRTVASKNKTQCHIDDLDYIATNERMQVGPNGWITFLQNIVARIGWLKDQKYSFFVIYNLSIPLFVEQYILLYSDSEQIKLQYNGQSQLQ
jgi:hypothetical protein